MEPALSIISEASGLNGNGEAPPVSAPLTPLPYFGSTESDNVTRAFVRAIGLFAAVVAIGSIGSYAAQIWMLSTYPRVATTTQLHMIAMMSLLAAQAIGGIACFRLHDWGRRLLVIASAVEIIFGGAFTAIAVWTSGALPRVRLPITALQVAASVVQLSVPAFFFLVLRMPSVRHSLRN